LALEDADHSATGTIARTITNSKSGATSPIAAVVHVAVLLAFVLMAASLAHGSRSKVAELPETHFFPHAPAARAATRPR
jgi:hypothetical protein